MYKHDSFCLVEDVRIAYTEYNPTGDMVLVFIHGNSSSAATWNKVVSADCLQAYHCLVIDLPAHGRSGSLTGSALDYTVTDMGKLLALFIRCLAIHKPLILVGCSLGTNIIAEMLAFDIRPLGIVLIGPCVIGGAILFEQIVQPGVQLAANFTDEVSPAELEIFARYIFISRDPADRRLFFKDYYQVQDSFRSRLFQSVVKGAYHDEITLLLEPDCPLAVIIGAADAIIDAQYMQQTGFRLWGKGVIRVADAGHWVQVDQPAEVARLIEDYCNTLVK